MAPPSSASGQPSVPPPNAMGLGIRFRRRRGRFMRDSINGITKPAIRRLARRGGVKRISWTIYDEIKIVLKTRLKEIIHNLVLVLDSANTEKYARKTITTRDVVFVLERMGKPVWGFDDVYSQK